MKLMTEAQAANLLIDSTGRRLCISCGKPHDSTKYDMCSPCYRQYYGFSKRSLNKKTRRSLESILQEVAGAN